LAALLRKSSCWTLPRQPALRSGVSSIAPWACSIASVRAGADADVAGAVGAAGGATGGLPCSVSVHAGGSARVSARSSSLWSRNVPFN